MVSIYWSSWSKTTIPNYSTSVPSTHMYQLTCVLGEWFSITASITFKSEVRVMFLHFHCTPSWVIFTLHNACLGLARSQKPLLALVCINNHCWHCCWEKPCHDLGLSILTLFATSCPPMWSHHVVFPNHPSSKCWPLANNVDFMSTLTPLTASLALSPPHPFWSLTMKPSNNRLLFCKSFGVPVAPLGFSDNVWY